MEDDNNINTEEQEENQLPNEMHNSISVSGMFENWYLDYASYVILERAVPDIIDGLKPVHRRILHSMKELDDGRYNKVANIIGNTMKYHPHGDASIGDALVQLGQKDLLIDCQGNWGNILTGDSAAAPRYIEARLSKFANEVVFNPKTTDWQLSYDGRNKEPIHLPVKFPLLLAQGVEGIAVGLASKMLPHNFVELIDASIDCLQGITTEIFPDFLTGGMIDVSKYNDGLRGGKIRIRSKIKQLDKKTLVIHEIPYSSTTTQIIDSVLAANEKGKIKIRKIEDNTAANVEILIHLIPGVSPDVTIDALYAFTDCEISVSPNACIIDGNKPRFLGVSDMLKISTANTLALLKKELEIKRAELGEQWHFASLEKIFIEKRIYRKIEECVTWESIIETIDIGLNPYKKLFNREITREDIIKLTEIKIKRISKFDTFKANELIKDIETDIEEVNNHLENLIDYAIYYFKQLKKKYGEGRERKTEIRNFDIIEATKVAAATQKLYVNREEGFIGYGNSLKKDEFVSDCSDIDDVIVFRKNGSCIVKRVDDKSFVGKDIIHVAIFQRNDDRTIYNLIYQDGNRGNVMVKRFAVLGVTRDKEYDLTKGSKDSKVLYFTANPNGEAETITIYLSPKPKLKKLNLDFEFSSLAIKGRDAIGNILTRHRVRKITLKGEGFSTLSARKIWFDDTVFRINTDERGKYLGEFSADDKILSIMQSGHYKITGFDLLSHFEEDLILIEKFNPEKVFSAVYIDGESSHYYLKRFTIELSDKNVNFTNEHANTKLLLITTDLTPEFEIEYIKDKKAPRPNEIVKAVEFISVKSYKAKGKRLTAHNVSKVILHESNPYEDVTIEQQTGLLINEEEVTPEPPALSNEDETILPIIIPDKTTENISPKEKLIEKKVTIKQDIPKVIEKPVVKKEISKEETKQISKKSDNDKKKDDDSGPKQITFDF